MGNPKIQMKYSDETSET